MDSRTWLQVNRLRHKVLDSLQLGTAKQGIQFLGAYKGKLIIEKGNKEHQEIIKEIATITNSDILQYIADVKGTPSIYNQIRYRGFYNLGTDVIHQFDTFFIDIDKGLYDEQGKELNYYKLKRILKGLERLGIKNYQTWLSVSGNIHVYIGIKAIQDKEYYLKLLKLVCEYFTMQGLPPDDKCIDIKRGVYLEGFRILNKGGFSSKKIDELSKEGKRVSSTKLRTILRRSGFNVGTSYRRCMYIIKDIVRNKNNNITQIALEHGVERSTLSRALQILKDNKAINYTTTEGYKGGIEILHYDKKKIDETIEYQYTRKQNYYFQHIRELLQLLILLTQSAISKLCEYIKDFGKDVTAFGYIEQVKGYLQGLLSGSSGGVVGFGEVADTNQQEQRGLEKIQKRLTVGSRYTTLLNCCVYKWRSGATVQELEQLARSLYSRMEQTTPFTEGELKAVVNWVLRIDRTKAYMKMY